jgi:acyl carrier protein
MPITISSRTPEGVPNHCPVCGAEVWAEPTRPPGDAPCPQCGTLLWFHRAPEGARCYESAVVAPVRERIAEIICGDLGVNKGQLADTTPLAELGYDSLRVVELVMQIEEEYRVTIPDDDPEQIRTFGDVIDAIFRRRGD